MSRAKARRRPAPKSCAKCEGPVNAPVLAANDTSELCPNCAMSFDPGSEISLREGFGFCKRCGGEHCPHYACAAGGGMGCCDNCSEEE